jgi:hypothetical protein
MLDEVARAIREDTVGSQPYALETLDAVVVAMRRRDEPSTFVDAEELKRDIHNARLAARVRRGETTVREVPGRVGPDLSPSRAHLRNYGADEPCVQTKPV